MKKLLTGLALAVAFASLPASAQYATRPVRLVVGLPPGGGVDILARLVSQKLTERWGKPVVVENRGGAAGNIATEIVAKSAPDGHTLAMVFSSYASNPALYPNLPFDINKDFTPVTLVATAPVVVIAGPSLPAKSLAELIEYARAHPGAVKFASSGIGTPVHLGGELMMQLTRTRMTHVPYKGIAPAMTAMLAGETEITFAAVLSGMQHFRSGRRKAPAAASRSRYPSPPENPTPSGSGLKGFEIDYSSAVLPPARIPQPLHYP